MLGVDLTVPILVLGVAVAIVLCLRAAVAWAERRAQERTDRLLRELGLDAEREVKGGVAHPSPPDGEPGAKA